MSNFWCERLTMKRGGNLNFKMFALNLATNYFFNAMSFLDEQLSVLHFFYYRGKINVVVEVWTCYQTSTNVVFF
jgi:hypothetical protein